MAALPWNTQGDALSRTCAPHKDLFFQPLAIAQKILREPHILPPSKTLYNRMSGRGAVLRRVPATKICWKDVSVRMVL